MVGLIGMFEVFGRTGPPTLGGGGGGGGGAILDPKINLPI